MISGLSLEPMRTSSGQKSFYRKDNVQFGMPLSTFGRNVWSPSSRQKSFCPADNAQSGTQLSPLKKNTLPPSPGQNDFHLHVGNYLPGYTVS